MKKKHRKEVGRRVKKFRIHMDMLQSEMVEFLDMGRANYSRIEKGNISPGLSTLKILQDRFGLNPTWIINNMGEMILQEIEGAKFNFGKHKPEVEALLVHMEKVPALKHKILAFFHEYVAMNNAIIEAAFNKSGDENA